MQRAGVVTVEDFDALLAAQKPAISKISENEKRIRKLKTAISHIDDLSRYKPVFEKSKTGFKSFREKYAEAHKDELDKFTKAVRYLKANQLNATDRKLTRRSLMCCLPKTKGLPEICVGRTLTRICCVRSSTASIPFSPKLKTSRK
jgi:hypothetical protein